MMLFCRRNPSMRFVACFLFLSILVLTACGGGGGTTPPPSNPVAPTITTQPQNQTVTAGQPATFSVTASGTAPLSYQWMKNGVNISGATSSSYTTPATTTADSGSTFSVKVSNSAGSATSSAATLTVNAAAPTITTQPQNQTVTAGQTATFSVAASGTAPLSYQWMKGGVNIPGATSSSYTTPATITADSGSTFSVKVSNSAGNVTSSSATLTVNAAPVAPTITAQPQNQTVTAGETASFSVTATGTTPLTYQWMKGGTNIQGATNSTYTTPATTTLDNGSSFTVKVSNSAGNITSNAATLTVNAPVVPTVTATTPASSATNVDINTTITATFSEAMDASTINTTNFKVAGAVYLTGTVSYDSNTHVATFTPSSALNYSATYTATITTGVTAADGTPMAAHKVWTFTTGTAAAVIDFGTTKQTIRGFGGSTAWQSTMPSAKADVVFGTLDNQIGLSILRVRIDPTSTAAGAQWNAELGTAQAAKARGAITIATPWSPPAAWKIETAGDQPFYSGTCDQTPRELCGGYLDPAHYADYAAYLNSFVDYFHTGGVDVYAISMQNEPDWLPKYESCSWKQDSTHDQIRTWVANNASVLTTKLIMPESLNFNTSLADPVLNDATAVNNVDIVGGHLYGVSPTYYANAFNKGKEVWMTEHDYTPSGTSSTMADALIAAKEIHDSLTVGNYNAYLWWWIANWYTGMKTGLVDQSNNPTYYGYAMSQYSRFIRPDYVRVNATANPTTGVYISAYSGNGHYVIVAINNSSSSVTQNFTIQGQTLGTLTPYQTTSTLHVAPQSGVTVSNGQFTYVLPAQSITTFVQ